MRKMQTPKKTNDSPKEIRINFGPTIELNVMPNLLQAKEFEDFLNGKIKQNHEMKQGNKTQADN